MSTTPTALLDLTADRIQLRVSGEPIGFAWGAENWFRAAAFVKGRGEVWPLPHQRHWGPVVLREQTLRELAKGTSGFGGEE
jgi:hypothetical protein